MAGLDVAAATIAAMQGMLATKSLKPTYDMTTGVAYDPESEEYISARRYNSTMLDQLTDEALRAAKLLQEKFDA